MSDDKEKKNRRSILIITYLAISRESAIIEYFKDKYPIVGVIGITSYRSTSKEAFSALFHGKEQIIYKKLPTFSMSHSQYKILFPILYVYQMLTIIFAALGYEQKFDVILGIGYFSTFCALMLKMLRASHKVIYFSYDYFVPSPKPTFYERITINSFYLLDKICCRWSDKIWNLSSKMVIARKKNNDKKFIVVPHGIVFRQENFFLPKEKNRLGLVFIGTLRENQGLDVLIEAMAKCSKTNPGLYLTIIGSGPYEDKLRRQCKALRMEQRISILGFLSDYSQIESIYRESHMGVALFVPGNFNLSRFTDPSKVKEYISYGLPIMMTDVSEIAQKIRESCAGVVVEFDKERISDTLESLMRDRSSLDRMYSGVYKLAKELDAQKILDNALEESEI